MTLHSFARHASLNFLRHHNRCQEELKRLDETLDGQAQHEKQLRQGITRLEQRLRDVDSQRVLLRTRQYAADASASVDGLDTCLTLDLDDTFERWETQVLTAEYQQGQVSETDELDETFTAEEDLADLRQQLADLDKADKTEV